MNMKYPGPVTLKWAMGEHDFWIGPKVMGSFEMWTSKPPEALLLDFLAGRWTMSEIQSVLRLALPNGQATDLAERAVKEAQPISLKLTCIAILSHMLHGDQVDAD